jgi:hypothetical protein
MQLKKITLALCSLVTSLSFAQVPSSAPTAPKPPAPMTAPAPMAPKAMAPAVVTTPAAIAAPASAAAPAAAMKKGTAAGTMPAQGGGTDKVWMNAKSNVYHCPGSKYYGKTKEGSYMTESDAKAKGGHAVKNKACGI